MNTNVRTLALTTAFGLPLLLAGQALPQSMDTMGSTPGASGQVLPRTPAAAERTADVASPQRIMQIQKRLNDLGYDAGPVDGVWGTMTETALRNYMQKQGLSATTVTPGQPLDPQVAESLQLDEQGVGASGDQGVGASGDRYGAPGVDQGPGVPRDLTEEQLGPYEQDSPDTYPAQDSRRD